MNVLSFQNYFFNINMDYFLEEHVQYQMLSNEESSVNEGRSSV